MNIAVRRNNGGELQPHAEFLEGNRHRGKAVSGLHDRERELAARQEGGFFAIHRNQIGLSEDLQKVFRLECFDHSAEVDVGAEQEQVQHVIEGLAAGGSRCAIRSLGLR